MPEMLVMDSSGDTKTIWDSQNADEVANARRTFDDLKKKRYLAYRVKGEGTKGQLMTEFDPDAEKMILSPPMAGG